MVSNFRFKQCDLGVFNTKNSDLAVGGLEKDCHIMGLTMGDFSLIDLIKSALGKTGPADVYIATWSAGIKDVHQVRWMMDSGLIRRVRLLTDHSYVNRQKKYVASIEDIFDKSNIRTSEMHAKFVVVKNENWNVVIVSSMNLNANKTCETFVIYESADITDFYMNFVNHHFDDMGDGFEKSGAKVSESLGRFFAQFNNESHVDDKEKHWSES